MSDPLSGYVDRLRARGCHTVLLSGSRARGDATATSDWDLIGIRRTGAQERDATFVDGAYLDAWLLSEADVIDAGESLVFVHGAKVVIERDGWGTRLLARVAQVAASPPPPLSPAERELRVSWFRKTLARAGRGDVEGDYRRLWLLTDSLEAWFVLRGIRYRGPKNALLDLATRDPAAHALASAAFALNSPLSAVEAWIGCVIGR
jgi:uncharacterized protein